MMDGVSIYLAAAGLAASFGGGLWGLFTHFTRQMRENVEWRAKASGKLESLDPLWKPQISARVDAVERQADAVETRMTGRLEHMEGQIGKHMDRLERRMAEDNKALLQQLHGMNEKMDGVLQRVPVLESRVDHIENVKG